MRVLLAAFLCCAGPARQPAGREAQAVHDWVLSRKSGALAGGGAGGGRCIDAVPSPGQERSIEVPLAYGESAASWNWEAVGKAFNLSADEAWRSADKAGLTTCCWPVAASPPSPAAANWSTGGAGAASSGGTLEGIPPAELARELYRFPNLRFEAMCDLLVPLRAAGSGSEAPGERLTLNPAAFAMQSSRFFGGGVRKAQNDWLRHHDPVWLAARGGAAAAAAGAAAPAAGGDSKAEKATPPFPFPLAGVPFFLGFDWIVSPRLPPRAPWGSAKAMQAGGTAVYVQAAVPRLLYCANKVRC